MKHLIVLSVSSCSTSGPYYEKAIVLRGMENTIFFASVN